jgi:hypothetical protein
MIGLDPAAPIAAPPIGRGVNRQRGTSPKREFEKTWNAIAL